MSAENRQLIDLAKVDPFDEWTNIVDVPMPEREFGPGKNVRWRYSMTPEGLYFFNMVFNGYTDAFCQVQCFYDQEGCYQPIFKHFSPTGKYIPHDQAKKAFKYIWGEIEKRTPRA